MRYRTEWGRARFLRVHAEPALSEVEGREGVRVDVLGAISPYNLFETFIA